MCVFSTKCKDVYGTVNRDAAQRKLKKRIFLPLCSITISTRAPLYFRELDTGELISYYFWQHFGAPRASLKIARIATLRNAFSLNYSFPITARIDTQHWQLHFRQRGSHPAITVAQEGRNSYWIPEETHDINYPQPKPLICSVTVHTTRHVQKKQKT